METSSDQRLYIYYKKNQVLLGFALTGYMAWMQDEQYATKSCK